MRDIVDEGLTYRGNEHGGTMVIMGVVLLLIGALLGVPILWTLGVICVVVGAVLFVLGAAGREVGGRRHYY
jgi:uncharacterized membrane protein HdeD (DUF308 family)